MGPIGSITEGGIAVTTADTAATAAIPPLSATAPSAGPPTAALAELADVVARFTALVSRRLPDDVTARLKALAEGLSGEGA